MTAIVLATALLIAAPAADQSFARKAAAAGMAEVELGKLAVNNASSADVKQFGQRMVDDHSKAGDELKSIAASKNITLPTEMDAKAKTLHARLSKLSGVAFDRAYMQAMVADHRQAATLFSREAQSGKDPEFKAFAAKTLPTVQEHLKMAQQMARVGTR
jgi:putative membrane protein